LLPCFESVQQLDGITNPWLTDQVSDLRLNLLLIKI